MINKMCGSVTTCTCISKQSIEGKGQVAKYSVCIYVQEKVTEYSAINLNACIKFYSPYASIYNATCF